jgi:ketosteroid isomerase-like protein
MGSNREFAERMYDALNRRDMETFLAGTAEDVEFRSLIAEAEGDTFRGRAGVRQWWDQVRGALGGLDFELEGYREEGDVAVTRIRVLGHHETTSIEQTMWQSIAIDDQQRVTWWQTFRTEEEAWAAVRERGGEQTG